jgi:Ca2+-binding RTX toxin-like protein
MLKQTNTTTFEMLESRALTSASLSPVSHVLTVNGTNGNDNIRLEFDRGMINVIENGRTTLRAFTAKVNAVKVFGNAGNDVINDSFGLRAADIFGGSGNDTIYGASASDFLSGGDGNDMIFGRAGNDTVVGDAGNDMLLGDAGDDCLDGGTGADVFWGGAGRDTAEYGMRTASVSVGLDGTAYDGESSECDNVEPDVENVNGGSGNDIIIGNAADNYLKGGGGNDCIFGLDGNDVLDGGVAGATLVSPNSGNDSLFGGNGNDVVFASDFGNNSIRGGDGNDTIVGFAGNDSLFGDAGDDVIDGGRGDDRIYGGMGGDSMYGGIGNDTLVAVNSSTGDYMTGNAGYDSFWCDTGLVQWRTVSDTIADADASESASSVHRIMSFVNGADRTPDGDNIADPSDSGLKSSFSSLPLFASDGPSKNDITQGALADCWLLATFSAVAKADPNRIRQSIVELGDGSYAVQFMRNGAPMYYRVDGELPTDSSGTLRFARLGHQGATWVAILEKAWAFFRRGENTYNSLGWGWPDQPFDAFGATANVEHRADASALDYLNYIAGQLAAGKAVTAGSNNTIVGTCPCVGSHVYTVESVNFGWVGDSYLPVSITLRNPWGNDGAGNDGNAADGYVTVTGEQFRQNFWAVQSATV